ncbi:MAG: hypothetical protein AVDCRST_MAG76-3514, partial [uncultured Acidimicrobiales bacterium]
WPCPRRRSRSRRPACGGPATGRSTRRPAAPAPAAARPRFPTWSAASAAGTTAARPSRF